MSRGHGTGAVIAGIGQTAVARQLEQSELRLTVEAIRAAVDDAGLAMSDIDGLASGAATDGAMLAPGLVGPDLAVAQSAIGVATQWQIADHFAPIHAIAAVASGLARHVVIYRTVTEGRAARQVGGRPGMGTSRSSTPGQYAYPLALGAVSPANWFAIYAQRHMSEFGIKREQLGWLPVTQRRHAGLNPDAVYREPITLDDYLEARWISTPLCMFDCDVPVDASTALVVSAEGTSQDLRHPIRIESAAFANSGRPAWNQLDDLSHTAAHDCATRLWSRTSLQPNDVDVAQLYDGFSYLAMLWLEALGFCGLGESGDFVDGGTAIGLGGTLPLNTWGGQLSGGRVHGGFGHMVEAVRQLRGDADQRQVRDAAVAVTSTGPPGCASSFLLTRP
jgi:acetyl-CoA acetyltransferase